MARNISLIFVLFVIAYFSAQIIRALNSNPELDLFSVLIIALGAFISLFIYVVRIIFRENRKEDEKIIKGSLSDPNRKKSPKELAADTLFLEEYRN